MRVLLEDLVVVAVVVRLHLNIHKVVRVVVRLRDKVTRVVEVLI
jgi:hypothetical protein